MNTELTEYYERLCKAYDSNEQLFITNHARAHNALIMRVMLEKAKEVNMYCGEMSVFRKGFYDHIRREDTALGNEMEQTMATVLTNFLTKPSKQLSVLFENYHDRYLDDLIVPLEIFKGSTVKLKKLPDTIANKRYIPHISFTGNERMVRFELDKDTHQAVCKIGIDKEKDSPKKAFENLMQLADSIDIKKHSCSCSQN